MASTVGAAWVGQSQGDGHRPGSGIRLRADSDRQIGVMSLIGHSADPKTTMIVFVGSFTLAFGVGATLTGFVFMMMEDR